MPFYLPFVVWDLRFVRIFRLFRIFRIAKLARYSSVMQTFGRVVFQKKEELLTTFALLCILLLVASCAIYYAEHDAQPETFQSIPHAMWWAVTTLSTVGYGDVYPVTALGKLIASVIALLGIGTFALPTGIIGAALSKEWANSESCPHCGHKL